MRLFMCALALSTAAVAGVIGASAELNPVRTHTHATQSSTQLIVKLRAATSPGDQAAGAGPTVSPRQRIANVAARNRVMVEKTRAITDSLHVMRISQDSDAGEVLSRLRADPEVEYAEPDLRRYAHSVLPPNDPLYPNQWYLQNATATPAAVDAITAWATTTGNASLVIADLDTGVRYDHPDLQQAASNGRLLPGYCFISDSFVNNGGTCRGGTVSNAEGSDPGDWITSSDVSSSPNGECKSATAQSSSWHGTRTAGILGALTNNAAGIAGMAWQGQILPVRVLGKCGGSDSDIVAAMLWAGGVAVGGSPANPTPAKIINMSLGGSGACPSSYQDAIKQLAGKGVLVVVSAGNENGAVDTPANCPGVAGVGGLRHVGTKVGYSSYGPEIAVSAPAGNCVNSTLSPTSPCVYPITSTTNAGTTTPSTTYTTSNAYTDQVNNPNLGTSFSAPIVSGIAALMASVNSNLSSCQLISRLKEGSTPFPQTSAGQSTQPPFCPQTDPNTQECICTLDGKTCGTGMANAAGAVKAALRPIAAVALPASVAAGQGVSLSAANSAAANGHSIVSYQWTSTGAQTATIQNATSATATVAAPACGFETVQLTVTDDAGQSDITEVVLSPTTATTSGPSNANAPACNVTPQVELAVCPASTNVQTNTQQSFTVLAAYTTDTAVTWEVNAIVGGNSTVGTISTSGVYTAPANVPTPSTVTIEAVSTATPTVEGSTTMNITPPPSSHGGGALDPFTLLVEAFALGWALRRYASR